MKRITAFALVLMLAVGMLPAVAGAAYQTLPIAAENSTIVAGAGKTRIYPTSYAAVQNLGYSVALLDYEIVDSDGSPVAYSSFGFSVDRNATVTIGGYNVRVPVATLDTMIMRVDGTFVINAKINNTIVGSTTVNVISSLGYTPVNVTASSTLMRYGSTSQLSVAGQSIISATSSDPNFQVSQTGLVTCSVPDALAGYADITVFTSSKGHGTIRLFAGTYPTTNVYATSPNMAIGSRMSLILSGGTINHAGSDNPTVATVSETGLVSALANGIANIYVYDSNKGVVGQYRVVVGTGAGAGAGAGTGTGTAAVTPLKSSIAVGETTLLYSATTSVVVATSLNTNIATVSGTTIKGVAPGTAIIQYATATGATGTVTVTVTAAAASTPTTPVSKTYTLNIGKTKTLKFSGSNVARAWTSDETIVGASLITGSDGSKQARYTAKKAGTATCYMTSTSGSTYAVSITVNAGDVIGSVGKVASGDPDLKVIARVSTSSTSKARATFSNGAKVTVTGESGDYYKISFTISGKTYTGYMKKVYVAF